MKGYVMILYVNAAIFGVVAVASLGYGLLLHRSANDCIASGGPDCERQREAANSTYSIAPFLFGIGIVLFSIGYFAHTRPPRPGPPPPTSSTPHANPPPEPPPPTP